MLKHLPLAAIALTLLIRTFTHSYKVETDYTPREIPAVAADLSEKLEPGTIAARKPQIAWYLNLHCPHYPAFRFVPLPKDDVLNEIRREKVDYLYLGPSEWYTRPAMRPLWLPQNAPPDFKPVYVRPDLYVTVYQLMRTDGNR
jgi:hypothetical protein